VRIWREADNAREELRQSAWWRRLGANMKVTKIVGFAFVDRDQNARSLTLILARHLSSCGGP